MLVTIHSIRHESLASLAWVVIGSLFVASPGWGQTIRFEVSPGWSSGPTHRTTSLAWGDVDNDGDLDLVCGNSPSYFSFLYENLGGELSTTPSWSSPSYSTEGVAWGDMDGDGDLDLACANTFSQRNVVYTNQSGTLSAFPTWSSGPAYNTGSVAWGDVDGDGDLDLACGNGTRPGATGQPNTLYENVNGTLSKTPVWSSGPSITTESVAWGDVDGDGDLDLVCGNLGQNRLYENQDGALSTTPAWTSLDHDNTNVIVLGDVDGDGDLDLVCGNYYDQNTIYRNEGGSLSLLPVWSSEPANDTEGITLGDADGDGDLDLACGNAAGERNTIYENVNGILSTTPAWASGPDNDTQAVAWGDVDNDGDLDLACANLSQRNTLYRNVKSLLTTTAVWSSSPAYATRDLAWGDMDGDGDLDLACGNAAEGNTVYENVGGTLSISPAWYTNSIHTTTSVAWGDVDGDGDLDLACGNLGSATNKLYENVDGYLTAAPVWSASGTSNTTSLAWADVDGDGDLDLACGNSSTSWGNFVYENLDGSLATDPMWTSNRRYDTQSLDWADVDGDGDLDLACGNRSDYSTLYENENGFLSQSPAWLSRTVASEIVGWGDMDGDGDPDLACGTSLTLNSIFLNVDGVLSSSPVWSANDRYSTSSLAWGDTDRDGDLDLIYGSTGDVNTLYENTNGVFSADPRWSTSSANRTYAVAVADVDDDGDLDLACGNYAQKNTIYANLASPPFRNPLSPPTNHLTNNSAYLRFVRVDPKQPVTDNILRVSFQVFDVESDRIWVTPQYQFEGETVWRRARLTSFFRAGLFESSPQGSPASFEWDISEFPSDPRPVVLRLLVSEIPRRTGLIQHTAVYAKRIGPVEPRRPEAFLRTEELHLPTVTVGDTVVVDLLLENRGNEPLVVLRVDTPSPELTVSPSPEFQILPHDARELTLTLWPRVHLDADGLVRIRTNDPLNPTVTTAVDADIRPLVFRAELLSEQDPIPLGEAATVIAQADTDVRIERGTLYHRSFGSSTFQLRPLTRSTAGFSATIPGAAVSERGIEFYVEMENSGILAFDPPGAPASTLFQAVMAPSRLTVVASPGSGADFLEDRDILISAEVERGVDIVTATVNYRVGGVQEYESSPLTGNPPLLTAVIPAAIAGSRGVEYWTTIQTATVTLLDPPHGTMTKPRGVRVKVSDLREPREHRGGRYRMLSVPLDFGDDFVGTIGSLLEFGDFDALRWRLFRYLDGNAELLDDADLRFRPDPGRAFWLVTRNAHQVDTAPVVGLSTSTEGPYPVALRPGWSQIGNPFDFVVAWNTVLRPESIGDPVAFDSSLGEHGRYSADEVLALIPFEGYFLRNSSAAAETLWVPPVEAPDSLLASIGPLGTHRERILEENPRLDDWRLVLSALTRHTDDQVKVGVQPDARDGGSIRRWKPPRPPGAWVRLGVAGATPLPPATLYGHDVRGPDGEGHRWLLVVRSGEAGEEIALGGWQHAVLPEGLHVHLIDLEQDVGLDLRTRSDAHRILSAGTDHDYRLVLLAGSEDYVRGAVETLESLPTRVILDPNAPNPFNPSTRLRFGLPRASQVSLCIFNVRGERVVTLIDREQLDAGYHTRIWSGIDQRGLPVASGVYLYRLTTDQADITRKMLLMQ